MNVYIMTDIEGISGIISKDQVLKNSPMYQEGRRLMTAEINVCVKACKEAGANKVYVRDCHADGFNVIYSDLCAEADGYIVGYTGQERFPYLDECDAVILLGYHAMAGTIGGTLEHTMSSTAYQNFWVNETKIGEIALDAGIVGEHGKPVIMVSGDDKACAEATNILPWAITAEVKKGLTWRGAMMLPIAKAHYLIKEKTIAAINNFKNTQTFTFPHPITLRAELTERGNLPMQCAKPYMKIIDGRTYEVTANTLEEALFRL